MRLGRRELTARGTSVRVANHYHAVSIAAGPQACEAAKARAGNRYLSREAPTLPVPGCTRPDCHCHYDHHVDRRAQPRRIVDGRDAPAAPPYSGPERRLRSSAGRRELD